MNGKFVEKYGLAWKDMDMDAKLQALMSEQFDTRETLNNIRIDLNENRQITNSYHDTICTRVDKIENDVQKRNLYWKILILATTPFYLAVIGILIDLIFKK